MCLLPLLSTAQSIAWKSQGQKGVVAAGKPASVQAGLDMLAAGGNAADAAVAIILAETITEEGDFCAGGEAAFMFYNAKNQSVKVLSGQGEAPLSQAAIDWYIKHGIPIHDIKAAAVPSVIDLCVQALKLYGTISFSQAVVPALQLLDSGKRSWYADLKKTYQKLVEAEQHTAGDRTQKLQAVSDRFYRGDIADSLIKWYQEKGSFLTKRDLANHVTEEEAPISTHYKGYTIYKCNTWTQGAVMLQSLNLLDHFNLKKIGYRSPEYIHLVTEALKLALADRDTYYGDPNFVKVPIQALLSAGYARLRAPLIDSMHASNIARPGDPIHGKALRSGGKYLPAPHGTTTCSVVDRWGNMVACTPSGWGSDAGPAGSTGIIHATRLISFNTLKGHPNCIAAGKRPRITLSPTLVLKDGKPVLAMSVEGGDEQDQTSLNLFLDIILFGMTPYQATTTPRFATNLHQDSFNPSAVRDSALPPQRFLTVTKTMDPQSIQALEKMGHPVKTTEAAIGSPAVIYVTPSGEAYGATDPLTPHYTAAVP
jgi:gamma-glutamyltranspeptidase/glutathione hydrolase